MTGRVYANVQNVQVLHEGLRRKPMRCREAQGVRVSGVRTSETVNARVSPRERKEDLIMRVALCAAQSVLAVGVLLAWVCRSDSMYLTIFLAPLAELGFYWLVGTAVYFGVYAYKKPVRILHSAAAVAVGIMWVQGVPCEGAAILGAVWLALTAGYWTLKAVVTAIYKPAATPEGR
ncbi:hypothetical protein FACS18948_6440 [Clostridia bacterium]|nr:hypothetical protein FACS18948_6440 [Clostridia bacterium]